MLSLNDDRDAVERPAHASGGALGVERARLGEQPCGFSASIERSVGPWRS